MTKRVTDAELSHAIERANLFGDNADTYLTAGDVARMASEIQYLRKEIDQLSTYFREEAPTQGFIGDVEGHSPVEAAIAVMRAARSKWRVKPTTAQEQDPRYVYASRIAADVCGLKTIIEWSDGRSTDEQWMELHGAVQEIVCAVISPFDLGGPWECKDYADGWIKFDTLTEALDYQRETGRVMRPVRTE